jgi:hypothetical protein
MRREAVSISPFSDSNRGACSSMIQYTFVFEIVAGAVVVARRWPHSSPDRELMDCLGPPGLVGQRRCLRCEQ